MRGPDPSHQRHVRSGPRRFGTVPAGTWFDGTGKHVHAVGDARSKLMLVQGAPVLVDSSAGRVGRVGPDGSVAAWSCLDVRAGDDVRLLGSAVSDKVYAWCRRRGRW